MSEDNTRKPSLNQALETSYRNMSFSQLFLLIILTPVYFFIRDKNSGIEIFIIKWSLIMHALYIVFFYVYIKPSYKNFALNEKYFWVVISSIMLYWIFLLLMFMPNLSYPHLYKFLLGQFFVQFIFAIFFIKYYKNVHKSYTQTMYGKLAVVLIPAAFIFARVTGEGKPEFARIMVLIGGSIIATACLFVALKCAMAWRADVLAMREGEK